MTLVNRIENKYGVAPIWNHSRMFRVEGKKYPHFYFPNKKVEAIYQRASRMLNAQIKAQNTQSKMKLDTASKNNDLKAFVSALVKTTCTIKRKHIMRFARENDLNFEVASFKNNDSWSFALNNECFEVRYGAVTKA